MIFGLAQAKARLSELASLADQGEEVVISKHGRPSYRLVAITSSRQVDTPNSAPAAVRSEFVDMASYVTSIRSKSRVPQSAENFVAEWRDTERF